MIINRLYKDIKPKKLKDPIKLVNKKFNLNIKDNVYFIFNDIIIQGTIIAIIDDLDNLDNKSKYIIYPKNSTNDIFLIVEYKYNNELVTIKLNPDCVKKTPSEFL